VPTVHHELSRAKSVPSLVKRHKFYSISPFARLYPLSGCERQ